MWNYLLHAEKPIVLYGTGNACEKIIDQLNARDITVRGIFASDSFVRKKTFRGFEIETYSALKERFGDMIVLLCFGTHLPDVTENIKRIAEEQELYAPDLPVAGDELFTREYYDAHRSDFEAARAMLADDMSRKVFDEVIEYKLTGVLDHLWNCESSDGENWTLLGLSENENYLDLGAYNGDTVRMFLDVCSGKYSSITAVEPDPRNFRKLTENEGALTNTELLNCAVSDCTGTRMFYKNSGRGSHLAKGAGTAVKLITADELSRERELSGRPLFSFIKMDLEGEEAAAIRGASETIKRCRPKLLISSYHRSEDLFAIPKQIHELVPDYKIYLRHSPCIPAWEVNYYFV